MTWRKNVSMALVLVALAGCAATTAPMTGDLQRDLKHVDPRIRIDSAFVVVAEGRADLASALADNLEDPDGAVRMFSAVALRKLTGQDFGYQAYNSPEIRREAISRWRAWIQAESSIAHRRQVAP